MKFESLSFTRCCCCLPLRYGLLSYGYFKLVVALLLLVAWIVAFVADLFYYPYHNGEILIMIITMRTAGILLGVADSLLTAVFVIGCHKKNSKLLRIYNYYSIVLCTLVSVVWFGLFAYYFVELALWGGVVFATWVLKLYLTAGMINTGLQVYLIFLTKSEILKLENNSQFSFTNNAADSECTMREDAAGNPDNIPERNQDVPQTTPTDDEDDDVSTDKNTSRLNGNYTKLN